MGKINYKKLIVPVAIVLGIILLDQVTKQIIINNFEVGERKTVISNFFHITSHRNLGAAWGILEGKMWFFYIMTVIAIGVIGYFLRKFNSKENPFMFYGLLLALGGTFGNFIDRIIYKEVVDFLDFNIFGYDYPTFNIADMALVIGVIMIGIDVLTDGIKNGNKKQL